MNIGEEQDPIEVPLPTVPEELPEETQEPTAPQPVEPAPAGS